MAQLTRALQKVFGSAGGTSEFGQIGSKAAGAAATTKDLETMQALTAYDEGLAAIVSDQGTSVLPYFEDINSLFFLTTSQLAYLMQSGVPEWDDSTEYYTDVSIVLRNGILYKDIYGTAGTPNLNYAPESNLDKWKAVAAAIGVVSLVDGANISNDASEGSVFTVTIGGNRTFNNWTNKLIGREYTLIITQDGTGNWNPVFDTDFVFFGNDVINQAPGAVTVIKCTVVSSSIVTCFIAGGVNRAIDSDAKNMRIEITGVDTLALTADAIQYINTSGETREEFGPISDSWAPSTDIIGGESGTDSQWLQAWRDSDGLMKLTLCEEGSATGTTSGYLVSSANTLYSRGAVAGDYLFNTTDYTYTKITTTPTANGQDIAVDDDIFANGETYKLVKNISPSGLGEYAACLGIAFQDSGLDLQYARSELQKIYSMKSEQIGRGTVTPSSFPDDDTVPQETEGSLIFTSEPFIPRKINSKILIEATVFVGETSNIANTMGGALFISGNSDALVTFLDYKSSNADIGLHSGTIILRAEIDSWGLFERTFSIRIHAANCYNYFSTGTSFPTTRYGVSANSIFKITEYGA